MLVFQLLILTVVLITGSCFLADVIYYTTFVFLFTFSFFKTLHASFKTCKSNELYYYNRFDQEIEMFLLQFCLAIFIAIAIKLSIFAFLPFFLDITVLNAPFNNDSNMTGPYGVGEGNNNGTNGGNGGGPNTDPFNHNLNQTHGRRDDYMQDLET